MIFRDLIYAHFGLETRILGNLFISPPDYTQIYDDQKLIQKYRGLIFEVEKCLEFFGIMNGMELEVEFCQWNWNGFGNFQMELEWNGIRNLSICTPLVPTIYFSSSIERAIEKIKVDLKITVCDLAFNFFKIYSIRNLTTQNRENLLHNSSFGMILEF